VFAAHAIYRNVKRVFVAAPIALLLTGCNSSAPAKRTAGTTLVSSVTDAAPTSDDLSTETSEPLTSESTTEASFGKAFVVQANGIDGLMFGASYTAVMEQLTKAHGAPSADSDWAKTEVPCDGFGTKQRIVTWGDVNIEFSDGPSVYGAKGNDHLIAVFSGGQDEANPLSAVTAKGTTLFGATVAQMKQEFPGSQVSESELSGPTLLTAAVDTKNSRLQAFLSGVTDEDTVVAYNSGLVCID
jgi:hypothetical protein